MLTPFHLILQSNQILIKELLKNHTTFHIGGPAALMLLPETEEELIALIRICHAEGKDFFVLGGGSNLLIPDEGLDRVVIKLGKNYAKAQFDGNIVEAEAGIKLSALSEQITAHALTGFEFACGIPGTVGGGVYMNAGAYDGEMKQIVESVRTIDRSGNVQEYSNAQMQFGYRSSYAMQMQSVISRVRFRLRAGDQALIQQKIEDLAKRRSDKQPLTEYSAGSTFKRPEGYFAGKLIEDAGLKGFSIGNAKVSEKHSGFVINKGACTYQEMLDFIDEIKRRVYEYSGVTLEEEVRIFGRNLE